MNSKPQSFVSPLFDEDAFFDEISIIYAKYSNDDLASMVVSALRATSAMIMASGEQLCQSCRIDLYAFCSNAIAESLVCDLETFTKVLSCECYNCATKAEKGKRNGTA